MAATMAKRRTLPKLAVVSSNVSDIVIDEDTELISATHESPRSPSVNDDDHKENILWQGAIFQNVQGLRHFKDSKSFVDHVLKTTHLAAINEHFSDRILNWAPQKEQLFSQSFGNDYNRYRPKQNNQMTLVTAHISEEEEQAISSDDEDEKKNLNFAKLPLPKRASFPKILNYNYTSVMDEFMKTYFFNPGFELLAGETPDDWKDNPNAALFTDILVPKDDDDVNTEFLMYFAKELNCLWKKLYREVNDNVQNQPYRYSFCPLKHPGIFVPGGRFREIYYWDTFWIIQGLIACGMVESSRKLVENLADLVERYGFVPNGTRKYYLTRSQPPLLTLMANEVYKANKDRKWLKSILPSLVKEYEYWTKPPVEVSMGSDYKKKKYKFARYYSQMTTPRPESYYEDRMTGQLASGNEELEREIYRNIRAAAASGWDFSSRWIYDKNGAFGNKVIVPRKTEFHIVHGNVGDLVRMMSLTASNLHNIEEEGAMSVNDEMFEEFAQNRIEFSGDFSLIKTDIVNVVPVDLNIFLCKVEGCLSRFYNDIGDKENAERFKEYEKTRMDSISAVLWDNYHHQFRDWNFRYKCFGNTNIASNFSALWLETDDEGFKAKQELLLESLSNSNIICGGGIVCSLYETGEQWDYPNCWAPVNHIIIEGLYNMGKKEYALKLANIWINNNYHTYLATKKMHEKYHCDRYGTGGGGEYKPQFGFGWTNGVCLRLMELFGPELTLNQS